jgi:hypothetical protein
MSDDSYKECNNDGDLTNEENSYTLRLDISESPVFKNQ